MRTFALACLGALLAAAQAGCHSYLQPFDWRPLPSKAVRTVGGDELEVEDGNVYLRPGSIAAALGVALENAEGGMRVTARVRDEPDVHLRAGDVIVFAAPTPADRFRSTVLEIEHRTGYATVTARMVRERGAPVGTLADIEVYRPVADAVHLDLEVLRDGKAAVVCGRTVVERRPLPVSLERDRFPAEQGVEICSLEDWPERWLPAHASREDLLVLRVARDSPLGRAGLRPLDVVPRSRVPEVEPLKPLDLWFPFLLSMQGDGRRDHLGLGPLDALFHYSRTRSYNPDTDSYDTTTRWSFLTTLAGEREARSGGAERKVGLAAIDGVRLEYFLEWLAADD